MWAGEAAGVAVEAAKTAKQLGYEIAEQAGLTAEDGYAGWFPLAIILYHFLYPPVRTLIHIESQVAGVLDQLYSWLGGAGSAVNGGIKSVENAAATIYNDITHW